MAVVTAVNSQNLALNKPIYVSSVEPPGTNAKHFVNDGNYSTYWASEYQDDEWIYIDLEQKYNVEEVRIYWEGTAYAKKYLVQFSSNGVDWRTQWTENNGSGGTKEIDFFLQPARFVRILCQERASIYGSAIYEIEVFGEIFVDYTQGQRRTTDGVATDQDGNAFEWIYYGTQDWAIENAEITTYQDGTPIPQVTDPTEWANLTTGAWCYSLNDSSKTKLYNWYAVMGIHDNNPETPNKKFAPVGWDVPSVEDWRILNDYLESSGYKFDGSCPSPYNINGLAMTMSSENGWRDFEGRFTPGSTDNWGLPKNLTGFNAKPISWRGNTGGWYNMYEDIDAIFLTTSGGTTAGTISIYNNSTDVAFSDWEFTIGAAVRFFRNDQTAMVSENSNITTIYPNPTTSIVTLQGNKEYDIEVYTIQGKKVMALTGNTIDMSHLSSATYIVKALDKVENEEVSYKVVKN